MIQPDEVVLFKSKGRLLHMRDVFRALPTVFVDVSVKLQQMADDGALLPLCCCLYAVALTHACSTLVLLST